MHAYGQLTGTKDERYQELLQQAEALITGEPSWLANLANVAALLYLQLGEINWAGFYLCSGQELVLGPFGGKPACVHIPIGKGVCGAAAATAQTQLVPDVQQFPGHIACDSASRSEIVVPILWQGEVVGVLDIDAPIPERFDATDRQHLEQLVAILTRHVDFGAIRV